MFLFYSLHETESFLLKLGLCKTPEKISSNGLDRNFVFVNNSMWLYGRIQKKATRVTPSVTNKEVLKILKKGGLYVHYQAQKTQYKIWENHWKKITRQEKNIMAAESANSVREILSGIVSATKS